MMNIPDPKYRKLIEYLTRLGDAAIAFSGGVDSTFLLKAAHDALGDKVLAITVKSPYIPGWEVDEAKEYTKKLGVKHLIFEVPMKDQLLHNPQDRCYLCKKFIFNLLREKSLSMGFINLMDGTNSDDSSNTRPGMKALQELEVISPLKENGFSKLEIRQLSKKMGLPTWDKPAYACLLTRIPYDTPVDDEILRRIEKSEKFLIDIGIKAIRVRVHGEIARIETEPALIRKIFEDNLLSTIHDKLKSFGFKYVTLDMGGYRENIG